MATYEGDNLELLDLPHRIAVASDRSALALLLLHGHFRDDFPCDLVLLLLLQDHIERAKLLLILTWI